MPSALRISSNASSPSIELPLNSTLPFSGFADEAATDIDGQIAAIRQLGWNQIELRNVDKRPVAEHSEEALRRIAEKLNAAGVRVNTLGSTVANWSKSILSPREESMRDARQCIAAMKLLDCRQVRIMSFAPLRERSADDQAVEERISRLRQLWSLFADAGIEALHENCENYGGMGPAFTRRLLDGVPGLRLIFDTANPATMADRSQPAPHPRQSSWGFYREVRDQIAHVHIKDGIFIEEDPAPSAIFAKARYTWPGEGHGDVLRIVTDLLRNGYPGRFSIEPHLGAVFHDPATGAAQSQRTFAEYGRRFMALHAQAAVQAESLKRLPPSP